MIHQHNSKTVRSRLLSSRWLWHLNRLGSGSSMSSRGFSNASVMSALLIILLLLEYLGIGNITSPTSSIPSKVIVLCVHLQSLGAFCRSVIGAYFEIPMTATTRRVWSLSEILPQLALV